MNYHAIITCFFLDTATNVYEYIETIWNQLMDDGIWINVGPLQWHPNAILQPSVNEIHDMILLKGFHILEWFIDTNPIEYRTSFHHPNHIRSTHYEAYRPLRFVLRK
jgi:hypothetical protein